jgi:CubicO group peptidase (beta-lactamase class C family)
VSAQEDRALAKRIGDALRPFVEKKVIAGGVGLVGNSDGVLGVAVVGSQDLRDDLPMKPDTIFRVMSMTKPITAVGVMMLAEDGKLTVDDLVEKHLPEFHGQRLASSKESEAVLAPRPITIRDLLTHTSGLPDSGPPPTPGPDGPSLANSVRAFARRPLAFEPGTKWSYSNSGMTTLGRIIEVVSGKPYDAFLKQRIFDPLGMPDTTFYPSSEQMKRVAVNYNVKDGELIEVSTSRNAPTREKTIPGPAGGLFSTASDMAKFHQMILSRGMSGGRRLLSEETVSEMTKVQTGDLKAGFVDGMGFGFGFGVVRQPSGVTASLSPGSFGHGGAFGTQAWIDPKIQVYSILMIQRVGLPNSDATPMRGALLKVAAESQAGSQ